MLSWLGHVERMSDERMEKTIYGGKVSGKRGRRRPRLTFENAVSKILRFQKSRNTKEGHVKSKRTPPRGRKRYVETVAFRASFSLTTPLGRS